MKITHALCAQYTKGSSTRCTDLRSKFFSNHCTGYLAPLSQKQRTHSWQPSQKMSDEYSHLFHSHSISILISLTYFSTSPTALYVQGSLECNNLFRTPPCYIDLLCGWIPELHVQTTLPFCQCVKNFPSPPIWLQNFFYTKFFLMKYFQLEYFAIRRHKSLGNCIRQKPPKSGKFSPCKNDRHPINLLITLSSVPQNSGGKSFGFLFAWSDWFVFTAPTPSNMQLLLSVIVLWYDRVVNT